MKTAEARVVYEFGPFRLDPAERLLLKEGLPVPLTPKAFDLLVYLAERPGRLVEKHALLSALWPDAVVEEANLAYNVSAVRKALGDGQDGEHIIQTVPTRGYRFVAPVRERHPEQAPPPARPRLRRGLAGAGLLAGALLAGLALWQWRRSDRTALEVVRFELASIATSEITVPAISPDGTRIVYSAALQGMERQLHLRALNSLQATPLPGTVGAIEPFFSPDGRSIGFFNDRTLMTLDLANSQLARVSAIPGAVGATWGRDGRIYFAAGYSGLLMVPASGGAPQTLATAKPGEGVHGWPELLPGGRHLLFTVWRIDDYDHAKVDVLSLDTGERQTVLEGAFAAKYLPSGHLAYIGKSTLFVVRFDPRTLRVLGTPVPVLDGVGRSGGYPLYAVSARGTLIYHPAPVFMATEMAWVSAESEQQVTAPRGYYVDPSLSPDDRRLALAPNYGAHQDIWVHDLARGTWTRLTTHPGFSAAPVWHPADPNAIVFTTVQPGEPGLDLFAMPADGSGPAELLHRSPYAKYAVSVAPAARLVAFVEMRPETRNDVWLLDLREKPAARPFLQTPARESCPALSPDGRWLAYESDESGRLEVYVRPVSGATGKWLLSTDGGARPRWSRDGGRIFYVHGNRMMTVNVAAGASFVAERPRFLVEARRAPGGYVTPNYELTLDGRLLLVQPAEEQPKIPLIVVQNWFSELRDKIGP